MTRDRVVHEVGGYSVIYSGALHSYFVKHNGEYLHKPKVHGVEQTVLEFYTHYSAVEYVEQLATNN